MSFQEYHGAPGYPPRPPSSNDATIALVLGLCGLLVCPLVCSILAIVYGNKALSEIDASGGAVGGRGQAKAGLILGWVGIGLVVLSVVLAGLLLVAFSASVD